MEPDTHPLRRTAHPISTLGQAGLALLRDSRNADIQNYISYAYWRFRQLGPAMGHYQQALTFSPRHRGAREQLGELYLMLGEPIKAEEQLAALKDICLIPCRELADFERAIAATRLRPKATRCSGCGHRARGARSRTRR
jgi:tetratricopeptide (TPR) repeat protein